MPVHIRRYSRPSLRPFSSHGFGLDRVLFLGGAGQRLSGPKLSHLSIQSSDCGTGAVSEALPCGVGFILPFARTFSGVECLRNKFDLVSRHASPLQYRLSISYQGYVFLFIGIIGLQKKYEKRGTSPLTLLSWPGSIGPKLVPLGLDKKAPPPAADRQGSSSRKNVQRSGPHVDPHSQNGCVPGKCPSPRLNVAGGFVRSAAQGRASIRAYAEQAEEVSLTSALLG
jgi:hypothetical protein